MPYDPRPISQGGNRGIDEEFSRQAPEGKFRVVSVDTFDGTDSMSGDFDSLDLAMGYVNEQVKDEDMLVMYVYDDTGSLLYHAEKD